MITAVAEPGEDAAGEVATTVEPTGWFTSFLEWLFYVDGFKAPSVAEFFPAAWFGDGTVYEFNRIMMVRIVTALVLIVIFWMVARRATVIPTRGQAALEFLLDFVRIHIVESVMGKEQAKRFVPFLTTLFVAIVAFNLTGVVPLANMSGTALIGLPLVMALWVYFLYLSVGVRKHGFWGYLKVSLFPAGAPWFVYPLLTPIEFLQVFVLRPATLALRLAANMMAGHLLLVLCFAATHYFVFEAEGPMKLFGAVSLLGGLAFTLFELFVSLLQAYVFVMLSSVYLNMALEDAH